MLPSIPHRYNFDLQLTQNTTDHTLVDRALRVAEVTVAEEGDMAPLTITGDAAVDDGRPPLQMRTTSDTFNVSQEESNGVGEGERRRRNNELTLKTAGAHARAGTAGATSRLIEWNKDFQPHGKSNKMAQ